MTLLHPLDRYVFREFWKIFAATAVGFPLLVIVFDLTAWGWIMLIWGVVLMFAGSALLAGRSWARWFTIVVGSLNFIIQLGFVGSSEYTLWALTVLAMNVLVLYALIVRWENVEETTI